MNSDFNKFRKLIADSKKIKESKIFKDTKVELENGVVLIYDGKSDNITLEKDNNTLEFETYWKVRGTALWVHS